jgi:hypothetical protein
MDCNFHQYQNWQSWQQHSYLTSAARYCNFLMKATFDNSTSHSMSKGQLGCVPWLLQIPWQVARVCRHILTFHSGLPFGGGADLDFATRQSCFHSLQMMLAFIPSLRSTKHREADLLQLFLELEDLHLMGPHLQSLNLSNCRELTRIHLKRPALVSLNLSLWGMTDCF